MTNDNYLRCYIGVLGVSMTSFEFFLLFYGILANLSVFGDLYSGIKMVFVHGIKLEIGVNVLNGVLGHFMAIISCIWCFFMLFFVILAQL